LTDPARPNFKTTLVQNLAKLITDNKKLLTLDRLRHKIKTIRDQKGKETRAMATRCEQLSLYMKNQVQVVHAQQGELLASLEGEFYKLNGRKPTAEEYTASMRTAAHLKSIASRLLLHEWKTYRQH
jgi:hypothetical protein